MVQWAVRVLNHRGHARVKSCVIIAKGGHGDAGGAEGGQVSGAGALVQVVAQVADGHQGDEGLGAVLAAAVVHGHGDMHVLVVLVNGQVVVVDVAGAAVNARLVVQEGRGLLQEADLTLVNGLLTLSTATAVKTQRGRLCY